MSIRGHHGLLLPAAAALTLSAEILADNPFCYYQLGETAGATTVVDSSPNARSLTNIVATTTFGSAQLCPPGTSMDLNGSGYVSSTSNQYGADQQTEFHGNKAVTYVFVVHADSLANSPVPMHLGNTTVNGSQGVFAQLDATGVVRFQLLDTSFGYRILNSSAGIVTAGTTYIIHMRRDIGGAAKINVNGVVQATGTMAGNIGMAATASSGGQRITLGALNASTPSTKLDGRLQHCAAFPAYLSDARVAAHVAASGL